MRTGETTTHVQIYISLCACPLTRVTVWRPGRGLSVVCAWVRSLCRLRDARLLYIRKQPHHQGVWAFKLSYVPRPSIVFFILARARARARVTVSLKGLAARGHLNTLQLLVIW